MLLESVAPSHRPFTVSGKTGEYLVGIPAQVVAYGYHGGVHESYASASSERVEVQEEHHLEEHPALQFHEAVVGHRIREVTPEMGTDEMQVVVLEVIKRTEVNIIRIVIISLSDMLAARRRRALPSEVRRGIFSISSSNFLLNSSVAQKISVIL